MKFLIFCGPIIKFLVNKYAPNLVSYSQYSEIVNKINSTKILLPTEAIVFVKILQELRSYLSVNNLTYRIDAIQNYVGDGSNYEGLLNILLKQGQEIFIGEYEVRTLPIILGEIREIIKNDISDLRIIAPLSLDDVHELYEFFQQELKIPVYPLSNGIITSKWLINFTFISYTPRSFYFPSNTSALDYIEKIRTIAKKENIKYLILKDEYDFDLRDIMPYSVTSLEKLEHYCAFFYEKSKGISNVGGLVIEEFLSVKNQIELYKSLIYDKLITEYGISNETKLKSFSAGDFLNSIIDSSREEFVPNLNHYNSVFNPIINNYYRYIISSIDYIIQNNHPYVIDLNGAVSTLKYLQKQKKIT